ncbi:hypothetical protein EV426DRAFT_704490 [Tirmania nivea]|nr:hypothetical protein EV426DRAFT_704490 [Tirmania nivea]
MGALLRMFLEDTYNETLVNSVIMNMKARGVGFLESGYLILSGEEIRVKWLKDKVDLISNMWYPIMDVVPENFLMENNFWAERMMKSTCKILSWMVTYFFKIKDADQQMQFERCPIAPEWITQAILKSEFPLIPEFPKFRKPGSWLQYKGSYTPYGALKYTKIQREFVDSAMEAEIDRKIRDSESGIVVDAPPAGLRDMMKIESMIEQADWMIGVLKKRGMALHNIELEARKMSEVIEDKCKAVLKSLWDHKALNVEKAGDMLVRKRLAEKFVVDAKNMFLESLNKEQAGENASLGKFLSSTEIHARFAGFIRSVYNMLKCV